MAIPPPPPGQQPPYGQGAPPSYGHSAPPPYGQGAPPPYGWQQPPPYGPGSGVPQAPHNGLAITSLVFGILCFLAPLALVCGLVALSQIKRRGDRGKGMAVAGVVLSSVGTALLILALSLGWAASFWSGFTGAAQDGRTPLKLAVGECFTSPTGKLEGETSDVDVVPCSEAHDGEVYGNFRMDDGAYPGAAAIASAAEEECGTFAESYLPAPELLPDNLYDYYFYPTRRAWSLGDREVTCLVGDEHGGSLTGSVRDVEDGGSGGGSGGTGGNGGSQGGSSGSSGDLEGEPGAGAEV